MAIDLTKLIEKAKAYKESTPSVPVRKRTVKVRDFLDVAIELRGTVRDRKTPGTPLAMEWEAIARWIKQNCPECPFPEATLRSKLCHYHRRWLEQQEHPHTAPAAKRPTRRRGNPAPPPELPPFSS